MLKWLRVEVYGCLSLWNSLKQDGLVDGDKYNKMLTVESM